MNVLIGELPPPYGGVAVKDKLVYKEVYEPIGVKMLDLVECKRKPYKIPVVGLKMLFYLAVAEHVIIGVGTDNRRKILMGLRKFLKGKKGLSSTIMLAMGGQLQDNVKKDKKLKKLLIQNQTVWVETEGMKNGLVEQGFQNVKIFPNCRTDEGAIAPRPVGERIKYVFFSRICAEKGVDEIVKAVEKKKGDWTLDMYGEVAAEFKETFDAFLKNHPEVKYHGVYDSTNGSVYIELNKYDAMLLPSRWKGEGVPGALVESKMSGITAIVSDWKFNAEIVRDNVEGIVLKGDLSETLDGLTTEKMVELKKGAFASRKRYCIDTYRKKLVGEIKQKGEAAYV